MSEQGSIDSFLEESPQEAVEEDKSFLEGICGKCLNTGFVHDVVNGILGVCFTTLNTDENGNAVKKLMVCVHDRSTLTM